MISTLYKVVRLYSDNFENAILEYRAYKALVLNMSTGDYHTHRHYIEYIPESQYTALLEQDRLITIADIED